MGKNEQIDAEQLRKDMKKQPSYSRRETAKMLELSPPTISNAVSNDDIQTVNTGGEWERIPVSQVLQYGMRKGIDPTKLNDVVSEKTGADDDQIFEWFMMGIKIQWLESWIEEVEVEEVEGD